MSSSPRIGAVGIMKAGCTNDIDGIMPAGNTDASSGARYGWHCPLPAPLLAQRDTSLTVSLKVGRCKILLRDLALVFFAGERPKGRELPEDNSSFVGVSTSVGMMGSFPSLRVIGYAAQSLSRALFPRSWLFSI